MAKPADTGARFLVLVGITYDNDQRRAEPGDVVDDLPPGVIAAYLREGVIEKVDPAEKVTLEGSKGRPVHVEKTPANADAPDGTAA